MESTSLESLQKGTKVYLRHPVRDYAGEFLALVSASRGLHRPWVYPPSNQQAFYAYADQASSERYIGCLVCLLQSGAIVGAANLSEIVKGPFRSAYLGYYGHTGYAGCGFMKE